MILIVHGSSTKTEWCLLDKNGVIEQFISDGINPLFQSRIEISRIIRLQLPQSFFTSRLSNIYYYGVECSSEKMKNIVKSPLETQLKASATVATNLQGIALSLFRHNPGIACILDSESNSCFYNGNEIVRNIPSIGYILGDHGSSVSLGKRFLGDCLQGLAPTSLSELFYKKNKIKPEGIMEYIYTNQRPCRLLSVISYFLYENMDESYVYNLIYNDMKVFLERNILQYDDFGSYRIRFVGPIAKMYSAILKDAAAGLGISIDHITESPMKGLIKYHQEELQTLNMRTTATK